MIQNREAATQKLQRRRLGGVVLFCYIEPQLKLSSTLLGYNLGLLCHPFIFFLSFASFTPHFT